MRILCLMGPTGSGKSAVAVTLAQTFNGLIINADSRQVYTDFPCITAQPPKIIQATYPHELYGFLSSSQAITAGFWLEQAQNSIKKAQILDKIPILVGGTGLYFRTLLDGITAIPPIATSIKEDLQKHLQENGVQYLYEELTRHDPLYAARIHYNDTQRVLRALEVYYSTGKTFSWWHSQKPATPPYEALRIGIGIPLVALTPFLEHRIDLMLEEGALEEVAKAYINCPDTSAPGWSGIGCREALSIHTGAIPLETAKKQWLLQTRAYAKRQWTWFRTDKQIHWFTPSETDVIQNRVKVFLKIFS